MRAVLVVVVAPCRNHAAGMAQRREQVLIEALLAHPAVEALDQAILHGLARRDIVPSDLTILLPLEQCIAGQFCPVVADDEARVDQLGRDLMRAPQ